MSRKLIFIAVVAVTAALLWGYWDYFPIMTVLWDGSYDLTVNISSSDEPIRSVRCEVFSDAEEAKQTLEYQLPPEKWRGFVEADPFSGEALEVHVRTAGKCLIPLSNNFSHEWELSRRWERYLVVIAKLRDGREVGKLVDIPDYLVTREISVLLP